jgi:hypothetical protein
MNENTVNSEVLVEGDVQEIPTFLERPVDEKAPEVIQTSEDVGSEDEVV